MGSRRKRRQRLLFLFQAFNQTLGFASILLDSNSIAGFSLFNLFRFGMGCCSISTMNWEVESFYSVKAEQNFIHRSYQQINMSVQISGWALYLQLFWVVRGFFCLLICRENALTGLRPWTWHRNGKDLRAWNAYRILYMIILKLCLMKLSRADMAQIQGDLRTVTKHNQILLASESWRSSGKVAASEVFYTTDLQHRILIPLCLDSTAWRELCSNICISSICNSYSHSVQNFVHPKSSSLDGVKHLRNNAVYCKH